MVLWLRIDRSYIAIGGVIIEGDCRSVRLFLFFLVASAVSAGGYRVRSIFIDD